MATREHVFFAIRSGLVCATLGSLVGGCAFVAISAVVGNAGLAALALLPMAVIYGAVTAVPFGFVSGLVGSWWLVGRARRVSIRRLYFEAVAGGALLGATYPLTLAICGWGPFENLVSALPISIGTGVICAIVLTREVRKHAVGVS
jgi:hypothetical protein